MKKGFTLIELLVGVLIIGILSAVALPQYEKAVFKARVATVLPLMRRWYDALAMYKLENGNYNSLDPNALGVDWPEGWTITRYSNSYSGKDPKGIWNCSGNTNQRGGVSCTYKDGTTQIEYYQPDEPFSTNLAGKRTCYYSNDAKAEKNCKALGGKKITTTVTVAEKYSYEF